MQNTVLLTLIKLSKLTFYVLSIICLSLSSLLASNGNAQPKSVKEVLVSIDLSNANLSQAFDLIEQKTDYNFIFSKEKIDLNKKLNLGNYEGTVEGLLINISEEARVSFRQINKSIDVKKVSRFSNPTVSIEGLAQERVTGKISDENGEPLPGATVQGKGTSNGTISDIDGTYAINVSENDTLVFSFVGFITQEVAINGRSVIDVELSTDVSALEEVVVVGYGVQKKAHMTGAVGTLEAKDFEKRTVTDVRQALQGSIPGLTIIDRGGPPGSEYLDFKIRGVGTIGNSQPLVLIDGIQKGLETIDSDDIESVTVLKDASASAIYGARAANGVILITTKRAKKGQFTIEFDGYYGVQTPSLRQEFLGAREYLELINESFLNAGQDPIYSEDYISRTERGGDPNFPYTDGWNELIGTGGAHDYSVRVMNGGPKANTYFSVNYVNQTGILPYATNERYVVTFNNTFNLSSKLDISTDLSFSNRDYSAPRDFGIGWALGDPIVTYKYPNGLYGFNTKNGVSPLAHLEQSGTNDNHALDATGQLKFNYELIDGLKIKGFAGFLYRTTKRSEFKPRVDFPDPNDPDEILLTWQPSSVFEDRGLTTEQTYRLIADYQKSINKHSIGILGGYEQIQNQWDGINAYRERIYSNSFEQLSLGDPSTSTNSGGAADWALMSYFGRANYNFDERYFLETSVRYDGSSRFAKGNKWGIFPAVSAGWMISNEPFMESFSKINAIKLRGSYGTLGNQNIGLFRYVAQVSSGWDYTFAGQLVPGYNSANYANTDITWESTTTLNLGFDFSFLLARGSFNTSFDWYRKDTDDILLTLPIPRIVGLWPSEVNAGKVRNQGWELVMSYSNSSRALGHNISFNISDVQNEVLDLAGLSPIISDHTILKEGHPIWASYGWQSDGLFGNQEDIDSSPTQPNSANVKPGDIKFVDRNEDGVIDEEDRYVMGSNIPRYTFGLNTQLTYKNFDLNILFQGALQSEVYLRGSVNDGPSFQNSATIRFRDRWTPENPDTGAAMPRVTANQNYNTTYVNDFWLRDAKYIRLKNLQIGYNLSNSITDKLRISSLRVFAGITNLFTITPLEAGLDPEINNGWSNAGYPTLSTYSLGLNAKL